MPRCTKSQRDGCVTLPIPMPTVHVHNAASIITTGESPIRIPSPQPPEPGRRSRPGQGQAGRHATSRRFHVEEPDTNREGFSTHWTPTRQISETIQVTPIPIMTRNPVSVYRSPKRAIEGSRRRWPPTPTRSPRCRPTCVRTSAGSALTPPTNSPANPTRSTRHSRKSISRPSTRPPDR